MPIYDYRCNGCSGTYDVLHKGREVAEDIVCPSCGSRDHTRLIGKPNVGGEKRMAGGAPSSCTTDPGACCGGGMCTMN